MIGSYLIYCLTHVDQIESICKITIIFLIYQVQCYCQRFQRSSFDIFQSSDAHHIHLDLGFWMVRIASRWMGLLRHGRNARNVSYLLTVSYGKSKNNYFTKNNFSDALLTE
jgi:hypothetical protein